MTLKVNIYDEVFTSLYPTLFPKEIRFNMSYYIALALLTGITNSKDSNVSPINHLRFVGSKPGSLLSTISSGSQPNNQIKS